MCFLDETGWAHFVRVFCFRRADFLPLEAHNAERSRVFSFLDAVNKKTLSLWWFQQPFVSRGPLKIKP